MWRLIAAAGVIFIYRYALKLSTPQADWWYVEEYTGRAVIAVRRGYTMMRLWLIGLWRYIPTTSVKATWETLKNAYISGKYGEAGT